MSEASQDAVITTGDPSIDYSPPASDTVTVAELDVTRFPQGSMVAVHGLRSESYGPYLDEPAALGKSTEDKLNTVTKDGVVTPAGHFHSDIKVAFDGDPYEPINYDDVNDDGVYDAGDVILPADPDSVTSQPNPFGVTTPIAVN